MKNALLWNRKISRIAFLALSVLFIFTFLALSFVSSAHAVQIAAGASHTVALKSDGTVWAWGDNTYGQLGTGGTYTSSNIPVQVTGLTGVTSIAAGSDHTVALASNGTVWVWGWNQYGQLGTGATLLNGGDYSVIPVHLTSLANVTSISAESQHTLALTFDGTVWAWGRNDHGQLGNWSIQNIMIPIQVTDITGVTSIAAGGFHTVALTSDGTVWAWGDNSIGQLGTGAALLNSGDYSTIRVHLTRCSNVTAISAGSQHTLALTSDGTVWAWGVDNEGQLGTQSTPMDCGFCLDRLILLYIQHCNQKLFTLQWMVLNYQL
jgi:alpha-tubulin suppressor-like RCC1 family protein